MERLRGGLSLLFSLNEVEVEDDNLELQEEDVWYYNYKQKEGQDSGLINSSPKKNLNCSLDLALTTTVAWSIPIVPKIVLTENRGGGGGGRQEPTPRKVDESRMLAPIPIPDWSKIYLLNSNKELWEAKCDLEKSFIAIRKQVGFFDLVGLDDDDDDDDGGDGELIPPHIILARREAQNHCISHSVYEGIGRTLKGRDLTNTRNSILKLTGFIEN